MPPFRHFDPVDATPLEGPTFEIGAVALRCVPYKVAGVLEDLPMLAQLDDLIKFVRGCLLDEDVEKYDAAIHDKRKIVRQELVVEIYEWLVETYADFTPGLRAPSETGQPGIDPTSEGSSDSQAGIPTPSTSPLSAP